MCLVLRTDLYFQFFFLEAEDLQIVPNEDQKTKVEGGLLGSLLSDFATLPKAPKPSDLDEYAVVNVSPSVVPNPYLPTFRIFSYNVSSTSALSLEVDPTKKKKKKKGSKRKHGHRRGSPGNNTHHCKSEEWADTWFCHLGHSWYSDPKSPSRSNQRWTPLGYAQVCGQLRSAQTLNSDFNLVLYS